MARVCIYTVGNQSDLSVHPGRYRSAHHRLFPPAPRHRSFGQCSRPAGPERAAAARISDHCHAVARAGGDLRLAAGIIQAGGHVARTLGSGLAYSLSAVVAGSGFVLLLVAAAWRRNNRVTRTLALTAAAIALAVIAVHPFAPVVDKGSFELSAIDVGQGDSLLTAFPSGQLMLIDAGGIAAFGRTRRRESISAKTWFRRISGRARSSTSTWSR
jgi:hypothetical protein